MFGGLGFLVMIIVMTLVVAAITSGGRSTLLRGPGQKHQLGGGHGNNPFGQSHGFGGGMGHGGQPRLGHTDQGWGAPQTSGWGNLSGGWGGAAYGDPPLSAEARATVDTDITRFGDELRDLDLDVVGFELNDDAQADYAKALDSYENAKQALQQATVASDITAITHILEEGRYAMACVKARALGKDLPERRPPCFFDPNHGPSVGNVSWSPDGGVAREVPACALDAARVRSGSSPHIRMVGQGAGMIPYWQDAQYAPYARGYYQGFGMDPAVRGIATGALMFGGLSILMGLLDD